MLIFLNLSKNMGRNGAEWGGMGFIGGREEFRAIIWKLF